MTCVVRATKEPSIFSSGFLEAVLEADDNREFLPKLNARASFLKLRRLDYLPLVSTHETWGMLEATRGILEAINHD